jgi:hypothetical protein
MSEQHKTKWEYNIEILDFGNKTDERPFGNSIDQLNQLGDQGWEVASILTHMGKGNSWTLALMKRVKLS